MFIVVHMLACVTQPELPPPPPPLPGTEPVQEPQAEAAPKAGPALLKDTRTLGAESCDPCALLMKYEFEDLKNGKACELCGTENLHVCEGWPSVAPACSTYDKLRNCIYARLGYDFEAAPEWKEVFAKEDWYKPDPDFDWNRVSPVQQENAETLRMLVKRKQCAH